MGQPAKSDERVSLQELAVSNADEIAALIAVLERKGILTRREILDEIQRQRRKKTQMTRAAVGLLRPVPGSVEPAQTNGGTGAPGPAGARVAGGGITGAGLGK